MKQLPARFQLHRSKVTKSLAVGLAVVAFVPPMLTGVAEPASAGPEATMIGRRYDDGLDSRLSAQDVSAALNTIGYTSVAHANGRAAGDAWGDGLSAAVFGAFGHANAGIFQTDEGPSDELDEILAAGDLTWLNGGNVWFWGNYLHYLDVDDMRLAIFAGCYTANTDPDLSSFGAVAEERGVDSMIGFNDLVFFPASCTSCRYSGNYFWYRFGEYAKAGDTIGVALSKARADLVALEGSAGGWDGWKLDGAVASPADIRLNPAAYGTELNSRPFGISPFDLIGLTPTATSTTTLEGLTVTDVETEEGVSYRRHPETGDLLWLAAPASVGGSGSMSEAEAAGRAIAFAEANVSWFDAAAGSVSTSSPSHGDGDLLLGMRWRAGDTVGGGRGPAIVDVEVDRRTGAVVYFGASRTTPAPIPSLVTEQAAVSVAKAVIGDPTATVMSATLDTWSRRRWVVTLDRTGTRPTPDVVVVEVDAATGKPLRTTAT